MHPTGQQAPRDEVSFLLTLVIIFYLVFFFLKFSLLYLKHEYSTMALKVTCIYYAIHKAKTLDNSLIQNVYVHKKYIFIQFTIYNFGPHVACLSEAMYSTGPSSY